MDPREFISLSDLATRFEKAKGMDETGYQWQRQAPGRKSKNDDPVGNSLAVIKAIRAFNSVNKDPIQVFKARGYDGTNRLTMVMKKSEIIRLKGFILRGGEGKPGRKRTVAEFKIMGKAEL